MTEVVCGVQFEGLSAWGTAHYGKFWGRIEDKYSESEDHPPLPRMSLDVPAPSAPQFSLLPPSRRVFFIEPPGNYLIQVQQNRFLHNWRKVTDEDEYPGFDVAYSRFLKYWSVFNDFARDVGLEKPRPDVLELTYINLITGEGVAFPRDVWDYLNFYEKNPEATTTEEVSALMIHFVWPLPNDFGVLTLDVRHGHRTTDPKEVLLMELSARGRPPASGDATSSWFETAHDAIVCTFDKLTTEKAHSLWGKRK